MEIRVLRYFLAIAKEGNITKAAERLHITQPTLSRQIMDLERELGIQLLSRNRKQIMLTDSGFLFLQRAKEIVYLADKTVREMVEEQAQLGGTISIGCVETVASRLLPELVVEFKQKYPMVKYQLYSADGNDIREKMDRDDIDLGILLEPIEAAKYDFIRLPFYEQWGIVMRSDDPLAQKTSLTVDDIKYLPLIVPRRVIVIEEIAKWLKIPSDELDIVASHNLLTNALLLVEQRIGYTICVKGAFDIRKNDKFCFVPFEPLRTTGHVLAWKKNQIFSSATMKFLHYIKTKY